MKRARRIVRPTGEVSPVIPNRVPRGGLPIEVEDEENPPHPEEALFARRNDHWNLPRHKRTDVVAEAERDLHRSTIKLQRDRRRNEQLGLCWCGRPRQHRGGHLDRLRPWAPRREEPPA